MNQSLRERILQGVMALLEPVAVAHTVTLHRSPVIGIPRTQSPALLLFAESDVVSQPVNDRVERHLVVRMVCVAREEAGASPHSLADRVLVAAHAALFSNVSVNGLTLGLKELDCEWDVEDGDASAVAIPARYQYSYRTLINDLATQG